MGVQAGVYLLAANAVLVLGAFYALARCVDIHKEGRALRHAVQMCRDELVMVQGTTDTLRTAIRRLEGRWYKREQSQDAQNDRSDGLPNPETDPEGWKKAVNLQIIRRSK